MVSFFLFLLFLSWIQLNVLLSMRRALCIGKHWFARSWFVICHYCYRTGGLVWWRLKGTSPRRSHWRDRDLDFYNNSKAWSQIDYHKTTHTKQEDDTLISWIQDQVWGPWNPCPAVLLVAKGAEGLPLQWLLLQLLSLFGGLLQQEREKLEHARKRAEIQSSSWCSLILRGWVLHSDENPTKFNSCQDTTTGGPLTKLNALI